MATIHAAANGTILRFLDGAAHEAQHPNPPVGTDESLTFDERTNAALIADIRASADPYRLNGGVLTKNDTPVVIAAESTETEARRTIETVRDNLRDFINLPSPSLNVNNTIDKVQARALL